MLYKLMIVDDEIWVIRGLLKTIPWKELGFEVVYHTTDSDSAKKNIALLRPDAVISDIRMASLTGLDLLEYASKLEEPPEFILISAYEEFEYAHKALKLGAFDYLIKPIKKSDMIHVLEKLKNVLDEKKDSITEKMEKQILEQHGEVSAAELFQSGNIVPVGNRFMVIRCAKKYFDIHISMNVFQLCGDAPAVLLEDNQFLYCILNIPDGKELKLSSDFLSAVAENMIFIGMSVLFSGDDMVYTYIQQARCAALQFLIEVPDEINIYQKERRLSKKDEIFHNLQEAFSLGKGEIILHLVQGLSEFIRKNHYTILDLIGVGNYICINLTGQDEDIFQKMGMESILVFLERYKSTEDYILDLENVIKTSFPEMGGECVDAEDIRKYVDKHYMEKILVGDIAKYFHMDLNYISRLFKKKTGKNLKDYLTEKRLEKAQYLLANTEMKVYEISEASGYMDYFYFTRVFRKMTGVTPSDWREKRKASEK